MQTVETPQKEASNQDLHTLLTEIPSQTPFNVKYLPETLRFTNGHIKII